MNMNFNQISYCNIFLLCTQIYLIKFSEFNWFGSTFNNWIETKVHDKAQIETAQNIDRPWLYY